MGTALQLGLVELRRELQVDLGCRRALGTSCSPIFGRFTWTFKSRQLAHGGLPIRRYGRREATSLIALSWPSGRSKFPEAPPGPGCRSTAPAGSTPKRGLRSAMAATRS
eukprot:9925365-Alexandrium_andersonii.AAC.1